MPAAPIYMGAADRNNEDSWHDVSWKHAHKEVQSFSNKLNIQFIRETRTR